MKAEAGEIELLGPLRLVQRGRTSRTRFTQSGRIFDASALNQ
jgi:hypothetical protein